MLKGKNSWKYRGKTPIISHGPIAEPMPVVQTQKQVCVLRKRKENQAVFNPSICLMAWVKSLFSGTYLGPCRRSVKKTNSPFQLPKWDLTVRRSRGSSRVWQMAGAGFSKWLLFPKLVLLEGSQGQSLHHEGVLRHLAVMSALSKQTVETRGFAVWECKASKRGPELLARGQFVTGCCTARAAALPAASQRARAGAQKCQP